MTTYLSGTGGAWRAAGQSAIVMPRLLCLLHMASRGAGRAADRAAAGLSLGAAPTFAAMAALTGIFGGGVHQMLCSAATPVSPLSGMLPMYLLMSVFHFTPWMKLFARWRSGATVGQPG